MDRKTCLECEYYSMDCGEETGRMSLDFCVKKQKPLPTAAFCFDDVCCPGDWCYSMRAFARLEEIAEVCSYYKKSTRR